MTAVAKALLEDIAIPRMGVRTMLASAYEGNDGSERILKKLGFEVIETSVVIKGAKRPETVFKWVYEK
jgi:RimJ/RimL family protein N-acetyltransferase